MKPVVKSENDKKIVYFIIKFFVAATLIMPVWYYAGPYYQDFIVAFSKPILFAMGYTESQIGSLTLTNTYLYNFNIVSFLALVVATPLVPKERAKLLAVGFFALFTVHVVDLVSHFPAYTGSGFAQFIVDVIGVVGVLVPIAVWFAMSYKTIPFFKIVP